MDENINIGKFKEELVEPYIEMDDHVCPKDILELIEEAKKEFPLDIKLIIEAIEHYPFLHDLLNKDVVDWYAKWFGSESDE